MTHETRDQHAPHTPDEPELAQDLEIEDAGETDAVSGGFSEVVVEIVGRPVTGKGE
jgi:hypothetical protein